MTDLHSIRTAGHKDVPHGTKLELRLGRLPSTVTIRIQLPGQRDWTEYPDLLIKDGVLLLPVPIVFLCHAKEDQLVVQDFSKRLHQDGILTWLDEKNLLPGHDWKIEIDNAIDHSDFVLVFLSQASCQKTGYFQREVRYALKQQQMRPEGQRFIVPVLIESCQPPRSLQRIQWVKLWENGAYESLRKALML